MPLGNFLYELESCSRYVTHRPNSGLSNGTKIITLGSLEKIGHAYFKKRHPQTPFASYFSNVICVVFGFYSSLELDYPKCKHNKKNPESSLCAYHGTPKAGPDCTCGISGTADILNLSSRNALNSVAFLKLSTMTRLLTHSPIP